MRNVDFMYNSQTYRIYDYQLDGDNDIFYLTHIKVEDDLGHDVEDKNILTYAEDYLCTNYSWELWDKWAELVNNRE